MPKCRRGAGTTLHRSRYLQRALQRAPDDLKVRAQYADLLLARGDYDRTLELLRDNEEQDTLLLRLAIAATRRSGAQDPLALRLNAAFEDRLQQSTGSARHQREQARFLLEVRRDPPAALQAATDNWQHQREPEDVRLLLTAARAAGDPDAATAGTAVDDRARLRRQVAAVNPRAALPLC